MLEQGQVAVEERGMSKTEQSENKVIRRDLPKLFISRSGCIEGRAAGHFDHCRGAAGFRAGPKDFGERTGSSLHRRWDAGTEGAADR